MKGSLNPGGIKDASASPLRALSGQPKCTTAGNTTIVYKWNIVFKNFSDGAGGIAGRIRLTLANVNNNTPPPGKPYSKWTAIFALNLNQAIPSTMQDGSGSSPNASFSIIEHPTDTERVGRPCALFPGKLNVWEQLVLGQVSVVGDFILNITEPVGQSWLTPPGQRGNFLDVQGPDLVSMFDVDWSSPGSKKAVFHLPEQNEFCSVFFYPFIRAPRNATIHPENNPHAGQIYWASMSNGFGISVAMDIGGSSTGYTAYSTTAFPDGTILGDFTITLTRGDAVPLFSFGIVPLRTVNFTNQSLYAAGLAATWDWDFGDGTPHSTEVSPSHVYASVGKYHVTLTATDTGGGVHSFDQFVNLVLIADFSVRVNFGLIVQSATITDKSIGAVTWDWDFGDGSAHSSLQHPPDHNYARHSSFTITLKIGDSLGNFVSKSITITTT